MKRRYKTPIQIAEALREPSAQQCGSDDAGAALHTAHHEHRNQVEKPKGDLGDHAPVNKRDDHNESGGSEENAAPASLK